MENGRLGAQLDRSSARPVDFKHSRLDVKTSGARPGR